VNRLTRAAPALVLAWWAFAAAAQVPRPFALQTWEPTPPGDRFFAVPGTEVPAHLVPSAGLALSWAAEPLVLRVDGEVQPGGRIVHRQFWGFLQGGLGFAGRVLFDASLPVALYQSGSRPLPDLPQVASTGMGDLRLGARMPLPPLGPVTTAGALDLWLPTGSRDAFTTDGTVRVGLKAMAGGSLGRIEYGGALGLLWRDARDLAVTRTGSAVTWSAGAAWREGPWRVGPELHGRFQFEGTETSPAEALLGGHWTRGAIEAGLALGTQLNRAPGAAPLRLVATVGWRPVEKAAAPAPIPAVIEPPAPPVLAPPPVAAPPEVSINDTATVLSVLAIVTCPPVLAVAPTPAFAAPLVITSPSSATVPVPPARMFTAPEIVPLSTAAVVVMSPLALLAMLPPASMSTNPPTVVTAALMSSVPAAFNVSVPAPAVETGLLSVMLPEVVCNVSAPLPATLIVPLVVIAPPAMITTSPLVAVEVAPTATPLVSVRKMPPVVVLETSVVAAVSMSPAAVASPIPLAATSVTVEPVMFSLPAPSPAVASVIAPAVASTFTVPLVVKRPSTTLVAAL